MSISRFIVNTAKIFRSRVHQFVFRNMFPPQLQVSFAGSHMEMEPEKTTSIFEEFILLAGPKSKISPARKREKHGRFIPERTGWVECERCGGPKVPHRICAKHADICAMREKEWKEHKKTHGTIHEPKQVA